MFILNLRIFKGGRKGRLSINIKLPSDLEFCPCDFSISIQKVDTFSLARRTLIYYDREPYVRRRLEPGLKGDKSKPLSFFFHFPVACVRRDVHAGTCCTSRIAYRYGNVSLFPSPYARCIVRRSA